MSKVTFDRERYLRLEPLFKHKKLDDVAEDILSEFSDDPEDLAYELAYTRYELARAEQFIELCLWTEEVEELHMVCEKLPELKEIKDKAWNEFNNVMFKMRRK